MQENSTKQRIDQEDKRQIDQAKQKIELILKVQTLLNGLAGLGVNLRHDAKIHGIVDGLSENDPEKVKQGIKQLDFVADGPREGVIPEDELKKQQRISSVADQIDILVNQYWNGK